MAPRKQSDDYLSARWPSGGQTETRYTEKGPVIAQSATTALKDSTAYENTLYDHRHLALSPTRDTIIHTEMSRLVKTATKTDIYGKRNYPATTKLCFGNFSKGERDKSDTTSEKDSATRNQGEHVDSTIAL
ncbi:hypothetical protein T265_10766 [Opisthorchis viverrini]|uniref:Uncharacterized protein n=1 Tax=Opisthorchis viverrini TaxID=6198 RepID=A0A074ZC18_OPIVI|nr:hypothetical protein T265_10766 [Opisthorchis viverrini]KER20745.1 hypothetical protein T265_10766 [Opisthorchis viverrini]